MCLVNGQWAFKRSLLAPLHIAQQKTEKVLINGKIPLASDLKGYSLGDWCSHIKLPTIISYLHRIYSQKSVQRRLFSFNLPGKDRKNNMLWPWGHKCACTNFYNSTCFHLGLIAKDFLTAELLNICSKRNRPEDDEEEEQTCTLGVIFNSRVCSNEVFHPNLCLCWSNTSSQIFDVCKCSNHDGNLT